MEDTSPANGELWSIQQVAEYFDVSESGARTILSDYGIRVVSGYPADQIRELRRPGRGARTDLREGCS